MDAQKKESHTLTGFYRSLFAGAIIAQCHNVGWQPSQEAAATVEESRVTCIAIQAVESLFIALEITWNPWPQGQVATECVSSPLLHKAQHSRGAVQEGACLAAENPGKWLLCARAPGPGHAKPQLQFLERSMHVLSCFVHHKNCMYFQLWFQTGELYTC